MPKSGITRFIVQFSSVTQLFLTLCNPINCSTPGLPIYPSPTPGVYSNSCPLSQWCHRTISSSVVPFCHLQSFPASEAFQMSQFFTSGGQSIGVSASASVLPMNIQDWFSLGWTGWISLQSKGLSRVFSSTTVNPMKSMKRFMVGMSLSVSGTAKQFSKVGKSFSIPNSKILEPSCYVFLPELGIVSIFYFSHTERHVEESPWYFSDI